MRAVDTNALVRILTGDDDLQLAKAEAFVAPGAWVSHLVLCETFWVLTTVYERPRKQLLATLEMLLANDKLALEDRTCVEQAVALMNSHAKVDFSDALILTRARLAGHTPLGTFDRNLAALSDTQRL